MAIYLFLKLLKSTYKSIKLIEKCQDDISKILSISQRLFKLLTVNKFALIQHKHICLFLDVYYGLY